MIGPSRGHHLPLDPSPVDATVVVLVLALLLFSIASALVILHFHLFSSSPRSRSHRLRDLNSVWAVRVLLVAFACLWALAELLRLPHLLHLVSPRATAVTSLRLCRVYVLTSHAFAQPCFFATLLYLLQASLDGQPHRRTPPHSNAFVSALAVALSTSFPFFALHVILLDPSSSWALQRLRIVPAFLDKIVGGIGLEDETSVAAMRCAYPLFSTVLLAAFGAVYVSWFLSVCLRAVAVVINKKLRVRLYALAAVVLMGMGVQVTVLALTALWQPEEAEFQVLGLIGFLAVFVCAVVGEGVLVVRPIGEAVEVGSWGAASGNGGRSEVATANPVIA